MVACDARLVACDALGVEVSTDAAHPSSGCESTGDPLRHVGESKPSVELHLIKGGGGVVGGGGRWWEVVGGGGRWWEVVGGGGRWWEVAGGGGRWWGDIDHVEARISQNVLSPECAQPCAVALVVSHLCTQVRADSMHNTGKAAAGFDFPVTKTCRPSRDATTSMGLRRSSTDRKRFTDATSVPSAGGALRSLMTLAAWCDDQQDSIIARYSWGSVCGPSACGDLGSQRRRWNCMSSLILVGRDWVPQPSQVSTHASCGKRHLTRQQPRDQIATGV